MRFLVAAVVALLVVGCGSSAPTPSPTLASTPTLAPTPSPSATPRPPTSGLTELPRPKASLSPDRYTKTGFTPQIGFTIGDGWSAQQVGRGFFDVQHDPDTPDVIAVQFAKVNAGSLQEAINAVTNGAFVKVVQAGAAKVDGHSGFSALVETTDPADTQPPVFRPVLDTAAGPINIASGRRLLILLFDAQPGVLAILVGGSIAKWDEALQLAQPVIDSVTIGE